MRCFSLPSVAAAFFLAGAAVTLVGCDTGFGKPCKLPKSPAIRAACNLTSADTEGAEGGTVQESRSSCAVRQYAGCETRVCLVFQGSNPFCSLECETHDDCPGSARCASLAGGTGDPALDCVGTDAGVNPECYCVRKSDLANSIGQSSGTPAASSPATAAP